MVVNKNIKKLPLGQRSMHIDSWRVNTHDTNIILSLYSLEWCLIGVTLLQYHFYKMRTECECR